VTPSAYFLVRWSQRRVRAALICAVVVLLSGPVGCTAVSSVAAPSCTAQGRVALIAQSVPAASYVPCLNELPRGWSSSRFVASRGHARFSLLSDRADGRVVQVEITPGCETAGSTPVTPRADGVRTSIRLRSISPRYAGVLYDVFGGGCISYRFDFARGPHITLMEDLESAVGLVSRRQLRLDLLHQLGVELDP
jgi:hypothetical protein